MKLCSQFESERPKYQSIALSLLENFKEGGDNITRSQLQLAKEYGVNRLTVRHALEWLERMHPEAMKASKRRKRAAPAVSERKPKRNVIGFPIFADSFAEHRPQFLLAQFRLAEAANDTLRKFGFTLDVQWVGTSASPNLEKIHHLMDLWDAAIVDSFDGRRTLDTGHPFYPMLDRVALVGAFQGVQHNCVHPDFYNASQLAISELVRSGARTILWSGSRNEAVALQFLRLLGVEKSLDSLPGIEILFAGGDSQIETAFSNVKNFFQKGGTCDAICCGNAYAAMATLRVLADLKLRVPEEVQVISIGQILYSNYLVPRPTTITAGMQPIGQAAAHIAMALAQNDGHPQPNILVPMNLIIGETTRRDSTASANPSHLDGEAMSNFFYESGSEYSSAAKIDIP